MKPKTRKKQGKVGQAASDAVKAIPRACADELAAIEFLEAQRWPDHPECPHCCSEDVYQMKSRDGSRNKRYLWRCKSCKRQYTVRVGTVFEDSAIPLRHWCYAFWRACSSKKGVSAKEIQRQTGLSYKSSLFLLHRIRYAMADDMKTPEPMTGTVEVDETYIGGKPRPKDRGKRSRGLWDKTPVVAMVQRDGAVRAYTLPLVNAKNLKSIMRRNIHPSAKIMTDEASHYHWTRFEYASHESVNHSLGEYARGNVTTNRAEGFFGILKRGINGVYHSVSKAHLDSYLSEFSYRYNTRHLEDGQRTVLAIRKAEGKRLMYREPKANWRKQPS